MASNLQVSVTAILANNYATLVMLTAIGYDYILTFSDEIEYIWKQHWTCVSTLFVFVRYIGIFSVLISSLLGSTFLPVPTSVISYVACVQWRNSRLVADRRKILYICSIWGTGVFIVAADLSMILRLWALYNKSTFILGTLLVFYVLEVIAYVISCVMPQTRSNPIAVTNRVLDFSFCNVQFKSPIGIVIADAFQIALGALMCMLATIRLINGLLEKHRLQQLQLSRYIKVLIKEGVIYFLAILSFALVNLFGVTANFSFDGWVSLLGVFQFVPAFTLAPRFILSLRKLYALETQGRRGSDIDTGFGLTLASHASVVGGRIIFALNERFGREEDMEMEERMG